jgi:tripartite-type tricarboxylate transporter receptor subunit TctC
VPGQDAAELATYARANPGRLNFAMLGSGSSTHLMDEMFRRVANVDIPDVPYKGAGPASSDLIAGHVQLNFDAVATAIPRIQSGKLKGLAISSDTRSSLLPSLPTFKELGMPEMLAYSWYGLLAPAGTPSSVVDRLNTLINELLGSPEIKEKLMANGATAPLMSAGQFGALIDDHTRRWERIVKPMNLQLD